MTTTHFSDARGYSEMKEREAFHVLNNMDSLPTDSESGTIELAATDKINSKLAPRLKLKGAGGAVTLTSTPSIVTPDAPTVLVLEGAHDTETITIKAETTLPGSGILLPGGADVTLAANDVITLYYSPEAGKWLAKSTVLANA